MKSLSIPASLLAMFFGLCIAPAAAAFAGDISLNQAPVTAQKPSGATSEADDKPEEDPEEDEDDEKDEEEDEKSKKPKVKTIAEFLKEKEKIDGLFPFYRDSKSGALYMEVTQEQLGQEYIYYTYVRNGVGGLLGALTGLKQAGLTGNNYIFSMRRRFGNIDIVQQDTRYVFDEDGTLKNGQRTNILNPVLATANIVAKDKNETRFIIAVSGLFKGKDLFRLGNASALAAMFKLIPSLSKKKTNIQDIRNYERNSAIIAEYVFDFKKAGPMSASVIVQHNIAAMPEGKFTARGDDPRVGFFSIQKTNLSKIDGLPYEDKIRRWRLEKKKPGAVLSEPVKPITYWIQNTTPLKYRDVIKKAVLRWNPVFEKAGYKNALRVEIQPDDAVWDAGDIRYNVIQWIASPSPGFNGLGQAVVNPRNGEILGANIVLEHKNIQRRILLNSLFNPDFSGLGSGRHDGMECSFANALARSNGFAYLAALAQQAISEGGNDALLDRIIEEGLYYLVLHEVGHTLGLTHNMKASHFLSLDELAVAASKKDGIITGSIMDYPAVNIAREGSVQGSYYPARPGPYDVWAIQYGYDERMADTGFRSTHLAKSGSPGLDYGNDAEAMNRIGRGIDPRVIPYDLSSQPIEFAAGQMELIKQAQSTLVQKLATPGESWDSVLRGHKLLLGIYRQQADTISRYIGGIYVDRTFVGQPTASAAPLIPVSLNRQTNAMMMLSKYVFAPDALAIPSGLLSHLQAQRRGFSGVKDPNVRSDVGKVQQDVLSHLLHVTTLRRLVNSGLYGNGYDVHTMLGDLSSAIFAADLRAPVNSYRKNLQVSYVKRLIKAFDGGLMDNVAISSIYAQITHVDKLMARKSKSSDGGTRAHRKYLRQLIHAAFTK